MLLIQRWLAMKIDAFSPPTPGHTQKGTAPRHDTSFWSQLISRLAEQANIDPQIAVKVAAHESGLNPLAVNRKSGAIGMMQLLPGTAADLGVNPHNVVENILGGVHYLSKQLTRFGDTAKALAAYNWGPRHVARAVERWGESWLEHAPASTQHYVNSIMSQGGNAPPMGEHSSARGVTEASAVQPSSVVSHGSSGKAPALTAERIRMLQTVLDAYTSSGILS